MMRNRHLSRAVANQGFYSFKQKLLNACRKDGIGSEKSPSSKTCSCCSHVKEKLSLSERIFHCESCGNEIDRDSNATINVMQAKEYVELT
jgi:putative transposase